MKGLTLTICAHVESESPVEMILAHAIEGRELGDAGVDGEHVHPSGLAAHRLEESGERRQIRSVDAARPQPTELPQPSSG